MINDKYRLFEINYKKYILDNGLEVVLRENHDNPTVAVAILYHVGSSREKLGKTGFAHLFEHLLFQRSEHVERNAFFYKISDLGGDFNGGTWEDGTVYYESVPNDALEKVLWMESDRMGFFINTVSEKGLECEKDVVINEKRQMYDNRQYGHTSSVIRKALYPSGHPYSWTVIGESSDIRRATLDDVREFYREWYNPNNATISISGDFDSDEVLSLVKKYFGEIKSDSHKKQKNIVDIPVLTKEIRLVHEDKFANLPELTMVFPAPQQYSRDSYALSFLCELLAVGKDSPLYKAIVEKNLAPEVAMNVFSKEICGEIRLRIRAFSDIKLDDVYSAIKCAFDAFEKKNISAIEMERIRKALEIAVYQEYTSNMDVAINMAESNVFGGSPDSILRELEIIESITIEDVLCAYNKYVKNKPFVATSFVPLGHVDLALDGSERAEVVEEDVLTQENPIDEGAVDDESYEFSASSFDRSVEPELGVLSPLKMPDIWTSKLANGIEIHGAYRGGLPLVLFTFYIKVGSAHCPMDKLGVAYITAKMLKCGTKNKSAEELENAFRNFGTDLHINISKERISYNLLCVNRDFAELLQLVNEVLTQPRWDEKEFDKLKRETLSLIEVSLSNPQKLGIKEFEKAVLGDIPLAYPVEGIKDTVENLTLDDVRDFYDKFFTPEICNVVIAGNIDKETVVKTFDDFKWTYRPASAIILPDIRPSEKVVSHVDYPKANQSFIVIGNQAITRNDKDYIPAYVANYKLGNGSSGLLFKVLRLEHGYTYGAYSSFVASKSFGMFRAYSNVQASVTKESLQLFRDVFKEYKSSFTEQDLQASKSAILRQESCNYETLSSLMEVLCNVSLLKMPVDYMRKEIEQLESLAYSEVLEIIDKYINIDNMKIVIVGDNQVIKEIN